MKTTPSACCLTVIIAALLACFSANAQEIDPETGTESLIGVCYEGEEKPFKMDELDEVRIAVGVEFLKEEGRPSKKPVKILDSDFSTKEEGKFYRVEWEPVNTSESPLLAPCKSTKY